MEVSWTFVLWVVVLLLLFHYFIFKPFLHGKLPIPLAKWVGRAVHYPKLPFVVFTSTYPLSHFLFECRNRSIN